MSFFHCSPTSDVTLFPLLLNPPALAHVLMYPSQSLTLMDEFSSEDGSRVNYRAMQSSSAFHAYCQLTTQLTAIPLTQLGDLHIIII